MNDNININPDASISARQDTYEMNTVLPDIGTAGNKKFTEFLANTFVCDMLYPIYGESSVTTIFDGWQGELFYNWSRIKNNAGDILEFYAEGVYVVKVRNESNDVYQRQTPKTIEEFIDDMHGFGIQLYWSDWVVEKYQSGWKMRYLNMRA